MPNDNPQTTKWSYATCFIGDTVRFRKLLDEGYEPFCVTKGWFRLLVHFKKA